MARIRRFLAPIVLATFAFFLIAMTMHALPYTRQPDMQSLPYAFEFLKHLKEGTIGEYLVEPKKYPLPYVAIHAVLYALVLGVSFLFGGLSSFSQSAVEQMVFLDPSAIHLVTRLFTAASAIALIAFTVPVIRRLFPGTHPLSAGILITASPLIFSLATSMRPHLSHLAVLMLTLLLSLRLAERKTAGRAAAAFAAAGLAFGFLQNGAFAFLLPFGALAWRDGRFVLRPLPPVRLVLLGIAIGVVSLAIGYPFLFKELLIDNKLGIGFGNEDIGATPWNPTGFLVLIKLLLFSELILSGFAVWSIVLWLRGRLTLHPFFLLIALYCVLYVALFGMVGWPAPRYFLPISIFLALLGAPAFARARVAVQAVVVLVIAAMHLHLGFLAFQPDTFDAAASYLRERTSGPIASSVPHHYLGIPPTRASLGEGPEMARDRWLRSRDADLPGARDFLPLSEHGRAQTIVVQGGEETPSFGEEWTLCREIRGAQTPVTLFLWNDFDTALLWLPRTRMLGPPLLVYCRKDML